VIRIDNTAPRSAVKGIQNEDIVEIVSKAAVRWLLNKQAPSIVALVLQRELLLQGLPREDAKSLERPSALSIDQLTMVKGGR
jgi:hypothetical protein